MTTATRLRRLTACTLILFAAHAAPAAAPPIGTQAPGYYRMMLGAFEITALLDGTHPFPVDDVMSDLARSHELLAESHLTPPTEGSINAFLVNTGDKLILIDSGAGILYGPCCGHLLDNLRAAGYRPEQVDEIYLTHLHRDHVGGVSPSGGRDFPNAVIRVSQDEASYWLSRDDQAKAPAYLGTMFDGAIASLAPYVAADKLRPFEGPVELAPGIRAVPSPGHAPGHTGYLVESWGAKILFWGDLVHVEPIQFPAPAITVKYDSDAQAAKAQRAAAFEEAAASGMMIGGDHLSFPGLGRIVKTGDAYRWEPAAYSGPPPR